MAFNAKAEVAANLESSSICEGGDLNAMGQGKISSASNPRYPLDTMGQGKLGGFQGGNLGTFMGQSGGGGHVK